MNYAYPPTGFVSNQQAVNGFKELLIGGFENPECLAGRVQITIPDENSLRFC